MKTKTFNVIGNSPKRCFFRSFYDDTLFLFWFTMDPYVHFVHFLPKCGVQKYVKFRFDLVLSNDGVISLVKRKKQFF